MQYILMIVLLAYGLLNLRYAFSKDTEIPPSLKFLFPNKILGIFIFIPESKRVMATRLVMAAACLFIGSQLVYYRFFI